MEEKECFNSFVIPYVLGYYLGDMMLKNEECCKIRNVSYEIGEDLQNLIKSASNFKYAKISCSIDKSDKKSNNVFEYYLNANPNNFWAFFAGYASVCATIIVKHKLIKLTFEKPFTEIFSKGLKVIDEPISNQEYLCANSKMKMMTLTTFHYIENGCINILTKLFSNPYVRICNALQFARYEKIIKNYESIPTCEFTKTSNKAINPNNFDMKRGYDIWCVDSVKLTDKLTVYDTHIKIISPILYHYEILPKSEFLLKGYLIQNFVVDEKESVKMLVSKLDDSIPDLTLPFCVANLQLRRNEHYYLKELKDKDNKSPKPKSIPKFITDLQSTKYKTGNDEIFKNRY
jgi:hypothetical protein